MALRRETPDIMADLLRNQPAAAIVEIPLDDIADNPFQPRQSYDQAALEDKLSHVAGAVVMDAIVATMRKQEVHDGTRGNS